MMPTPNEPANCCVILKIELTSVDFSFATKVEALAIVLEKAALKPSRITIKSTITDSGRQLRLEDQQSSRS